MQKFNDKFTIIFFKILTILFLFISIFIPFASAITLSSGGMIKTYSPAFSFIFSGNISSGNMTYKNNKFSIIALIAYLILLVSCIMILFSFILKNKKISLICNISSCALIIIESILFLCAHQSVATVLSDALIKGHSDTVANTVYQNTSLCFGFYGISIFSLLSLIFNLLTLFFINKKENNI